MFLCTRRLCVCALYCGFAAAEIQGRCFSALEGFVCVGSTVVLQQPRFKQVVSVRRALCVRALLRFCSSAEMQVKCFSALEGFVCVGSTVILQQLRFKARCFY